ncbi:MAG: hypothetical protein JNM81_03800 [Rhodospirillaceae bacterium]|nr:hypothetical protein [Rhodospirillaceae bacterium]
MPRFLVLSFLVFCLGLSIATVVPAAAQPAPAENAAQSGDMGVGPAPKGEDPKICRRVATTGSRVGGERVCKTAAEWQREEKENQAAAKELSRVRGATKGQ